MDKIKKPIILDPDGVFEFEIAKGLSELIDDKFYFYHIIVNDDMLIINKEGYNNPGLDSIVYDMKNLVENDVLNQKKDAISQAYAYTFSKTGDLEQRISELKTMFDGYTSHNAHAFYHDRTGNFPEEDIAKKVEFNKEVHGTQR